MYDKVLVLDAGRVAAFDTPANLFDAGGLFQVGLSTLTTLFSV